MDNKYEINSSTLAILAVDKNLCKIVEKENEFFLNTSAFDVINSSCKFFGSSYVGRFEGTKCLTGINYKAPIIIEETNNIIFFPTASPRSKECSWIALNHIFDYKDFLGKTVISFIGGNKLKLNISYAIIENQVLRATKLDSVLTKRKKISINYSEYISPNYKI